MTYSAGFMIEGLVAVLLVVTIGYCILLNSRLKRLKADEQSLKGTIAELITATEIAERAVSGLKATAHECDDTLGKRLRSAEHCCVDLQRQVAAGERVLGRMARVVTAGRGLDDTPVAAPTAPDAKTVAAAARSFAERLHERVGAQVGAPVGAQAA